jgi:hypothetical protein
MKFENHPRVTQAETCPPFVVNQPEAAAFLQCRKIPLLDIQPSADGRFLMFCFPGDQPVKIRGLILEFEAGGQVAAKEFAEFLKSLKIQIAQHRRKNEAER